MLDAFIIEEIQRRERENERLRDQQRPRQDLPIQRIPNKPEEKERAPDRGVVIIDYSVEDSSLYDQVIDIV